MSGLENMRRETGGPESSEEGSWGSNAEEKAACLGPWWKGHRDLVIDGGAPSSGGDA